MRWQPKGHDSSLSIDRLLHESKEKETIKKRQTTVKRSGFTDWGIWRFLGIKWK